MPNYCIFSLMVQGRPNDVEEVVKTIKADYNYNTMEFSHKRHLFRVFKADIVDDSLNNGIRAVEINGECAWSVAVCMTEEGYYKALKEEYKDKFRGTSLLELSKDTNTMIEVYSEEEDLHSQEHMLFKNGKCIINETRSVYEIDQGDLVDKSLEEHIDIICELEGWEKSKVEVEDMGDYYFIGRKDWDFQNYQE